MKCWGKYSSEYTHMMLDFQTSHHFYYFSLDHVCSWFLSVISWTGRQSLQSRLITDDTGVCNSSCPLLHGQGQATGRQPLTNRKMTSDLQNGRQAGTQLPTQTKTSGCQAQEQESIKADYRQHGQIGMLTTLTLAKDKRLHLQNQQQ